MTQLPATVLCAACKADAPLCAHTPEVAAPYWEARSIPAGSYICRECAYVAEREIMRTATRFCAYLASTTDGKPRIGTAVTTWPGGLLGHVTHVGKVHPWSRGLTLEGERYYIRCRDVHGNDWTGTGAPGMYCRLRRLKVKGGAS